MLVTLQSRVNAATLDAFSHTAVSGTYLQHGRGPHLFDSPSNVTMTVGAMHRVYCVQARGLVPTSIEWYNPQGQLVSRDTTEEVNQVPAGGGRIIHLNFKSYQQDQGGKYECRVAVPGNNLKRLSVCISECVSSVVTSALVNLSTNFPVTICANVFRYFM